MITAQPERTRSKILHLNITNINIRIAVSTLKYLVIIRGILELAL